MAETGGTGADALIEVLVAQLIADGVLTPQSLATMARRLEEAGHADASMALSGIRLSHAIDTPEVRRATLHVIDPG